MKYAIEPITVLEPHGVLALEKYCADDLDVVNAAKASFAKYAEEIGPAERGLIGFLIKNKHTSPLEHTFFKFHVRAPIAVARDWVRHRIGTAWNEESGRYVVLRPDFYIPTEKNIRSQVGKPGSYTFESITDQRILNETIRDFNDAYGQSTYGYQHMINNGVAKELARYVLPVGIYTEWIWSCNAHSLMHFLTLRNAKDAMLELRLYAHQMEEIFAELMPVTAEWFRKVERGLE